MSSILITGGAGFIGSHTCLLLLESGYKIFVIDAFVNSSPKSIENVLLILKAKAIDARERIHLIKGDIKNPNDIERIFKMSQKLNNEIEAVIHFAGLKSVSESILEPFNYWENNVSGTINLLKIMKKFNCRNIVFSSSATVYKSKSDTLINESDICAPINPYGYTKLTIERILRDAYNSEPSKWRIASLRYFNPVGAHESGFIGEDPLEKPNSIYPQITRVAIGKLDKIKIFGSDWITNDGTGVRDYIHVMDLAKGHILALNYLIKEKPQNLTVNLGTGKGTSVLELIKVFEKVNKVKIPYTFVDRRPGDNAYVVANNSLARSILNFKPSRTIEDICRDGWNWQLQNPNGFE